MMQQAKANKSGARSAGKYAGVYIRAVILKSLLGERLSNAGAFC